MKQDMQQSDMPFENKVLILLENIDRKIELTGERMDMLDQKMDHMEQRLGDKVDRLETRLIHIEATMTPESEFHDLKKRVEKIEDVVF